MTVEKLIEVLQKAPKDLEVYITDFAYGQIKISQMVIECDRVILREKHKSF